MKIIGVAGRKGAGKDTFAQPLITSGFVQLRFADPLKHMLRALMVSTMRFTQEEIESYIEGDLKQIPIDMFDSKTMRELMQSLGTEWGRNLVVHDLWLRITLERLKVAASSGVPAVVITDARFPNEVEFIQKLGGYVVRINRATKLDMFSQHSSERDIDALPVDEDIHNDSIVQMLHGSALRTVERAPHSIL